MSATPTSSPGTIVVWLIGNALLIVLCVRLTILAIKSRTRVARPQAVLWEYFAFVGIAGVLYGSLGMVVLVSGTTRLLDGALTGLLLTFTFLCALLMREAYFNKTLSNAERDRIGEFPARRAVEVGLIGTVLVVGFGPFVTRVPMHAEIAAAGGAAAVVYGVYFQRKRAGSPATRGTLIDTLLRQLVPVLAFAGGGLVAPLLESALGQVVSETVTGVFVVMTGTSLIVVTIKLRQHLATQR